MFIALVEHLKLLNLMLLHRHVRRYAQMYMLDAAFEINCTYRYTLHEPEACVLARKEILAGKDIKQLNGVMHLITGDEEDALNDASDFSTITASRLGGTGVLFGPARFVNHDCKPNCRLITQSKENVSFVAIRDIKVGDEITICYADSYFGEHNCDCLCRTCEAEMRGGFKASHGSPNQIGQNTEYPEEYGMQTRRLTQKRKRTLAHQDMEINYASLIPLQKRSKYTSSSAANKATILQAQSPEENLGADNVNGGMILPSPPNSLIQPVESSGLGDRINNSDYLTDISDIKVASMITEQHSLPRLAFTTFQIATSAGSESFSDILPSPPCEQLCSATSSHQTVLGRDRVEVDVAQLDDSDTELSEIDDDELASLEAMFAQPNPQRIGRNSKQKRKTSARAKTSKPRLPHVDKALKNGAVTTSTPNTRQPGDTERTVAAMAIARGEKNIACSICAETFWSPPPPVQMSTWRKKDPSSIKDPSTCPRCHRHWILYQVDWPRTVIAKKPCRNVRVTSATPSTTR